MKTTAIILAAGKGKRMQTDIPKQYLLLEGHPILYYSIRAFEESFIDEIILVTGKDEISYCQNEIVNKYGFQKVKKIVAGGRERYHSVYEGLKSIVQTDYVYIHDGARPFITNDILEKVQREVEQNKACVVGMPVKDTIKIVGEDNRIKDTPNRKLVWQIQTPQTFSYELIQTAYNKLMEQEDDTITDDAMVVEKMLQFPISLVEGSYENIKITTPEDLQIGRLFLKNFVDSHKIGMKWMKNNV